MKILPAATSDSPCGERRQTGCVSKGGDRGLRGRMRTRTGPRDPRPRSWWVLYLPRPLAASCLPLQALPLGLLEAPPLTSYSAPRPSHRPQEPGALTAHLSSPAGLSSLPPALSPPLPWGSAFPGWPRLSLPRRPTFTLWAPRPRPVPVLPVRVPLPFRRGGIDWRFWRATIPNAHWFLSLWRLSLLFFCRLGVPRGFSLGIAAGASAAPASLRLVRCSCQMAAEDVS